MSEGEVFLMFACVPLSFILWSRFYAGTARVSSLGAPQAMRLPLYLAPIASAALLLAVLRTLAAVDVRDSALYTIFYMVFGAAWTGMAFACARFAGLHVRDDAVERGNGASVAVAAGALPALTLCFAGANIGNGPGWWVVVFSGLLSTGALFAFWVALGRLNRWHEIVSVDRDLATGIRIGGWLLALGLILGRAVAGDWVSAGATVVDFVKFGWPAAVLFLAEWLTGRMAMPSPSMPRLPVLLCGLAPAAVYVAVALGYVLRLGLHASGLEAEGWQ